MEPAPTLAEDARLLRPGGVFAAYNHDFYPVLPGWRAERVYRAYGQQAIALDKNLGRPLSWANGTHLNISLLCKEVVLFALLTSL